MIHDIVLYTIKCDTSAEYEAERQRISLLPNLLSQPRYDNDNLSIIFYQNTDREPA